MDSPRPVFPAGVKVTIYFLGFFAFLFFLSLAADILIPLTISLFFAMLLHPLVKRLEKWGLGTTLSISLSLLFAFIAMTGALFFLGAQLFEMSGDFPRIVAHLEKNFHQWIDALKSIVPSDKTEEILNSLKSGASSLINGGGEILSGIVAGAAKIGTIASLVPFFAFILLLYRVQFKRALYQMMGERQHEELESIMEKSMNVIRGYVTGLFTVMLIVAALISIGLWIAGIPYAVFFGIFASLFTIIPYVGLPVGAVPPLLLALTYPGLGIYHALGVVAVFAAVYSIDSNFLTPNITGGKVRVNPLAAIIAFFTGGMLWGTAGLILFIPITAVLKVIFDTFESTRPFGMLLGTIHVGKPPKGKKKVQPEPQP